MFRFNTRKKKPKLYNELIIMGITAVLILAAVLFGGPVKIRLIMTVLTVFFAVTTAVFFDAFRKQVQYNPYSYNTIFYFGFGLLLLLVFVELIVATVECYKYSEIMEEQMSLFNVLSGSAVNFMLLSAPFILVFSIALFVSNISLIRHETKRIQNLLGMILAVILIAGEVIIFLSNYYYSGSLTEVMLRETFVHILAALYLYFECMLIGAIVAGLMTAHYRPDRNADYIIILGCRVGPDGKPYPLLKGRIDKAIEFYRQQIAETGKAPVFIPSGGKGSDEVISECGCMKNYLLEQGIPEEHILEEDKAENTYQNMLFSKQKIEEQKQDYVVLFSTTNYHVFRSGLMGRRVKLRAIGIGAKTKWYFWPNASVREFFGLLQGHKIKQGLVLGCLIAGYVVLTLVSYL